MRPVVRRHAQTVAAYGVTAGHIQGLARLMQMALDSADPVAHDEFQWRDPREVERLMEQWYATTSIQWLAPECCRVYKSDDGVTARCEIELLGMVGAV